MKKAIIFSALCLLIVQVTLFISRLNQFRVPESEQFFSQDIFEPFHENVKQYILKNSKNHTELEESILDYKPSTSKKNREFYQKMIIKLRKGNDPSLVMWYYQSSNVWELLASKFERNDSLDQVYQEYLENSSFGGRIKSSASHFDLNYQGNLPFPLFKLEDKTLVIRMGNVVYDLSNQEPVAPEFRQFLTLLDKDNKTHLYVNHMSRGKKEQKRLEKIHALESKYPAITVVTLDKDSKFYNQEGVFEHLYDAEAFKRTFIQRLISEEGYIWSPNIKPLEWGNSLKEIVTNVHQHYFKLITELTIQERQEYIDIVYLEIIKELNRQYQFDSLNISCKHTIDRAATSLALLYYDQEANVDQSKFLALALSTPIVFHNRPLHEERFYRLKSALERLRAPVEQAVIQGVPGQ